MNVCQVLLWGLLKQRSDVHLQASSLKRLALFLFVSSPSTELT